MPAPRLNLKDELMRVRALYLDIAHWAVEDPARWGPWVAPCPITNAEIQKAKDDLQTSAKQAGLLVTATSSDATNTLFINDAKRNAKESSVALGWGLFVLAGAEAAALASAFGASSVDVGDLA